MNYARLLSRSCLMPTSNISYLCLLYICTEKIIVCLCLILQFLEFEISSQKLHENLSLEFEISSQELYKNLF